MERGTVNGKNQQRISMALRLWKSGNGVAVNVIEAIAEKLRFE